MYHDHVIVCVDLGMLAPEEMALCAPLVRRTSLAIMLADNEMKQLHLQHILTVVNPLTNAKETLS